MKSTTTLKRKVSEVNSQMSRGSYSAALQAVESLLDQWPGAAPLHILRAELIQLGDESGPSLDEAKKSLAEALKADPNSIEALIEQGHFQFAVDDDAKAAAKTFEKAIAASAKMLVAALLGRAAALAELDRRQEAFDCLAHAQRLQNSNGALKSVAASNPETILTLWESISPTS